MNHNCMDVSSSATVSMGPSECWPATTSMPIPPVVNTCEGSLASLGIDFRNRAVPCCIWQHTKHTHTRISQETSSSQGERPNSTNLYLILFSYWSTWICVWHYTYLMMPQTGTHQRASAQDVDLTKCPCTEESVWHIDLHGFLEAMMWTNGVNSCKAPITRFVARYFEFYWFQEKLRKLLDSIVV
jgi:hypothetical protein